MLANDDSVLEMLEGFRASVGDVAETSIVVDSESVSTMRCLPRAEGACPITVAWSAHEVVVGFGQRSSIEFGPGENDLSVRRTLQAIVEGRACQLRELLRD